MTTVRASAEGTVAAPAETVYGYLADYERHHPRFLPPAISSPQVEEGGVGAGTVFRCTVTAGGRSREYRMRVAEPEPGRVLSESDLGSSLVTTFTVVPQGAGCAVRIETTWSGASGVGGFFERMFAPRAMGRIYADELERLAAYARDQGTP
jgi:Polyketide cyclase / dehydrase and lipid transport